MLSRDILSVVCTYLFPEQIPEFFAGMSKGENKFRYNGWNRELSVQKANFLLGQSEIICTSLRLNNITCFLMIPTEKVTHCVIKRNRSDHVHIDELCHIYSKLKTVTSLSIRNIMNIEFDYVNELQQLRTLELIDFYKNLHLNELQHPELLSFKLIFSDQAMILKRDLYEISKWKKLKNLELYGAFEKSVDKLCCEKLKYFKCTGGPQEMNDFILLDCPRLQVVEICRCSLKCIKMMPVGVRVIKLIECDELVDLWWLKECTKLKYVVLIRCENLVDVDVLDMLKRYGNLERIRIEDCPKLNCRKK